MLQASLRLLEAGLARVSDIVLITEAEPHDEPGPRIVYVNAAFERHLGYTAEEAIGRSPRFLQGPATERAPLERIRRAVAAREGIREELVNYTKAGDIIHLEIEIAPVLDDEGRCTHFIAIERNVSERRAVENALRLSEERFRLLSRATNDAVWDWDIVRDVVWWGDGFAELFGAPDNGGRALEQQWLERLHDDDRERVLSSLQHALSVGAPAWSAEYRFRHANGAYLWVCGRGHILRDETGSATRMIGSLADVTHRRSAEAQLKLLAAALDSVTTPVLILQADAHVEWVNRAFTDMTGYSWAEAIGRHISTLLFASSSSGFEIHSAPWATLLRGETWSGEVTNARKDSSEYPAHVTLAPVRNSEGVTSHYVGLVRDLTQERLHDQHMLRVQRIENVGMLASGIAHDLNNVLSPILLSVEYLREAEADPERMEVLAQMESSTKHGAALLRRLLMFARGTDGARVSVSARMCVEEVAGIVSRSLPRSITLQVHTELARENLLADPTQLRQVLMNLCFNACHAMPEGGTLTVEATSQVVDDVFAQMHPYATPGRYTVFRVSDTGTGMTADVQEQLFEPFFTTKPIGEGTGLGLSTVVAIVRSHGGFIQLTSAVNEGSTFKVFLPVHADAAAEHHDDRAQSSLPRGAGQLVLVVDDEAAIREVMQRSLELFGYRVLTAEHGATALAEFAKHINEVEVVVLDMLMPVLDGAATIVALKALDPDVCIIASSGAASNEYVSMAAKMGVKHFVQKPFAASELLNVLSDCLKESADTE